MQPQGASSPESVHIHLVHERTLRLRQVSMNGALHLEQMLDHVFNLICRPVLLASRPANFPAVWLHTIDVVRVLDRCHQVVLSFPSYLRNRPLLRGWTIYRKIRALGGGQLLDRLRSSYM
jgi:hypothetical protein